MAQYKVTPFQATRWIVTTKAGVQAANTPVFFHDQKQTAQAMADALNAAFDAGKVAQKLETYPMLAALCS